MLNKFAVVFAASVAVVAVVDLSFFLLTLVEIS